MTGSVTRCRCGSGRPAARCSAAYRAPRPRAGASSRWWSARHWGPSTSTAIAPCGTSRTALRRTVSRRFGSTTTAPATPRGRTRILGVSRRGSRVSAAMARLRAESGIACIGLVGVRMGAALAALAARTSTSRVSRSGRRASAAATMCAKLKAMDLTSASASAGGRVSPDIEAERLRDDRGDAARDRTYRSPVRDAARGPHTDRPARRPVRSGTCVTAGRPRGDA